MNNKWRIGKNMEESGNDVIEGDISVLAWRDRVKPWHTSKQRESWQRSEPGTSHIGDRSVMEFIICLDIFQAKYLNSIWSSYSAHTPELHLNLCIELWSASETSVRIYDAAWHILSFSIFIFATVRTWNLILGAYQSDRPTILIYSGLNSNLIGFLTNNSCVLSDTNLCNIKYRPHFCYFNCSHF
jgi:hypothetical protein